MEEIMRIKGTNGTIIAYDEYLVIARKGALAIASHGIQGDRTYFYRDIASIEYKKPGLFAGYIKIIVPGTLSNSSGIKSYNSFKQNNQDDNTVILSGYKGAKSSDKMYNFVMGKILKEQN